MLKPIQWLLQTQRKYKRIITVCYDILAVIFSLYFAMALRLDSLNISFGINEILTVIVTICITIFTFIRFGMYRAILRYMMLPAIGHIFLAVLFSAVILTIASFFFHAFIPRSIPFIYAGLAILTLGGPRIFIRSIYYKYYKKNRPNVIIYGAGTTGRDLTYSLINGDEYNPIALLDDDPDKQGQILFGIKVYDSNDFSQLKSLYHPVKLLLAINNISKGERLRLLERLSHWPIEIQSVPCIEDIAAGKARATDVGDLNIADLLGRAPVDPDPTLLSKNITGKIVMVTGAGGSIGSELCRQIFNQHPHRLILFELNEFNLYVIDQELQQIKQRTQSQTEIVSALGSVQKINLVKNLMTKYQVETVYHAAAYKHVPLVEDNVVEGMCNNVFGTLICAKAAIHAKVRNFTLISTDKAVRPTNVMGASKRMAELVLQGLASTHTDTIFTMVRFGNVLGSSGSVVPLFRKQIRKGGPITVTHPDIIRYFMLIPEAAQLVIQASAMGNNGQVFVLDMGEPVKILDLAKRMIHLMGMTEYFDGKEEDGDIEIQFTGLRPGEKLYEELLIGDNVEGTSHQKIMTATEKMLPWEEMQHILEQLEQGCKNCDANLIIHILKTTPMDFHSNLPG